MLLLDKYTDEQGITETIVDADDPDKIVVRKTYQYEHIADHAQMMRNEVVQTGEVRKVMSIPRALFNELMRNGKLGELAFVGNKPVVDKKMLPLLMKEFSKFNCVDKL